MCPPPFQAAQRLFSRAWDERAWVSSLPEALERSNGDEAEDGGALKTEWRESHLDKGADRDRLCAGSSPPRACDRVRTQLAAVEPSPVLEEEGYYRAVLLPC